MFAATCGMISTKATTLRWSPQCSKSNHETNGSGTFCLRALATGLRDEGGAAASFGHILTESV